jgi:hypothetical protein
MKSGFQLRKLLAREVLGETLRTPSRCHIFANDTAQVHQLPKDFIPCR